MKKEIRKFVLANAYDHNGKAQTGAIIGKLISAKLISRDEIKKVVPKIKDIVKEVNNLCLKDQEKELKKIYPDFFKKEKKEECLKELPDACEGKVVTRMPPEPSKYIHVGHALSFLINYLYSKKYKGKCILRFEDTNPEKSKQEYVDSIIEDLKDYLGIKPDSIVYESDDISKMYNYAKKLIEESKAYVCTCSRDKMRELRNKGECCPCRSQTTKENLKKWNDMLEGKYKPGKAILRLKIDMCCNNYCLRDPAIFRMSSKEHYRQGKKYSVWPLYDFAAAIEEELCGITHVLRSSEFGNMRIELQNWISEQLDFKKKTFIQYGRFNVIGSITQGRKIRDLIKENKVSGWDDPSLVTLKALKRRGIKPETFKKLAIKVGLSKTETQIDWSMISAENRKILDSESNRYFFTENPVKIHIKGAQNEEIKLKLHPNKDKGYRKIKVNKSFYISEKDAKSLKKGQVVRLKDHIKVRIVEKGKEIKAELSENQKLDMKTPKIQWVPVDNNIKISVLKPDHSTSKGFAETTVSELSEGDIVQFERYGFCRLDNKKTMSFIFGHK